MQELAIIQRFISRVRRELVQRRAVEGIVFAGVLAVAWVLAALVLAPWLPQTLWMRVALWAILAVASIGTVGWTLGRALARTRDERTVAREIERAEPRLRNDLVTALQFGADPGGVASPALVAAHLKRTARETERYRDRTRELYGARDLAQPGRLAAVLGVVAVLVAVTFPGALRDASQLLLGIAPEDALPGASAEASGDRTLLVRDLGVELRYPSYTGLLTRRHANPAGRLEVLRGTEVRYDGRLTVSDVASASVVMTDVEGQETERAATVNGDRIQGAFVALDSGTWRFRITQRDGTVVDRDVERAIQVQEDFAPIVSIESPQGTIDVTEKETLRFAITAIDDFGLTEVALTVAFQGAEDEDEGVERTRVATVSKKNAWQGEAVLDISTLDVQAKDVLVVHAEALDNDEVLRPKPGRSAPVLLRIASPEDRHEAVLEQEQELVDKLVDLLGDYLENPVLADEPGQLGDIGDPVPYKPAKDDLKAVLADILLVSDSRARVLSAMQGVVDRMAVDELMLTRDYELVKSLHGQLEDLHREAVRSGDMLGILERQGRLLAPAIAAHGRRHRIPQVERLERTIVLLEELITSQWLDAAQMTVNQIKEIRDRLIEQLEEYRKTQDAQLKAEIMRDVQRLQQRIDELLERLSRQMQHVPQEHANVDAMAGGEPSDAKQEMQNLAAAAEAIREMLQKGDIDGALEALRALDEGLQGMLAITNAMTSPGGGGGGGMSELDQKASDLMDAVNDLAAAESTVEQSTAELRETMRERHAESMKEQLDPFIEAQRERLDAIRDDLAEVNDQPLNDGDRSSMSEVERTLDSLERLLELGDVEGMRPIARRLDESSGAARRRMMQSRAMLRRGSGERAAYDGAIDDMREVESEASSMLRDIEDLLDNARPEPNDEEREAMEKLAEQQRQIGEAADALKEEIEGAASDFPQFEQLAPQMDGAKQFMDDASSSLEGGEIPNALEGERQALRSLRMMKDTLQQTVQKQRQQGPDEENGGEKVAIPDDAGPQRFHQDVMDAMKQPGLGTYEDENSLYYKSLVE